MQVNNAAVSGGKILNGDALLRKVGLLPLQLTIVFEPGIRLKAYLQKGRGSTALAAIGPILDSLLIYDSLNGTNFIY